MKYNQLLKVSALLSSIFLVSQAAGWKVEEEERLIQEKFLNDAVVAKSLVLVRPPAADGSNKATNVSLSYNQIIVHEVDDSNGYISVSMWESMVWTDKRLSWTPDDYDGVDKITIPPSYIWLPAISVYTPSSELGLAEDETGRKVVIAADGNVVYVPTKRARFRCDVDLKYFPYDVQVCHLKVGSWVHHQKELNIIGRNFGLVDTSFDLHHTDWKINSSLITSTSQVYSCCLETYQTIDLKLILVRKAAFFYYIFIIPTATINVILPFIHFIPPTGSQKTNAAGLLLVGSILMHLMLYQQLRGFAEDNVPLLLKIFDTQLTMIVTSIVISASTASLASVKHTSCRVPAFMRKILSVVFGRICCFGRNEANGDFTRLQEMMPSVQFDANHDSAPIVSNEQSEHGDQRQQQSSIESSLQYLSEEMRLASERRQLEKEWYQVAILIDRLAAFIFIIYTIVMYARFSANLEKVA